MPKINFTDEEVKALGVFVLGCVTIHKAADYFKATASPEMFENLCTACEKFAAAEKKEDPSTPIPPLERMKEWLQ